MNWQAIAYCLGLEILHHTGPTQENREHWCSMVQDMANNPCSAKEQDFSSFATAAISFATSVPA